MVLLFSIIGAIFAAAETALISLRESQVKKLSANNGRKGKRLEGLVKNPNRFLAAGQVAITLTGFFAAAYGEKRFAPLLTPVLERWGLSKGTSEIVAFIGCTVFVAYIALVVAELTPKRLALQHAERYSLLLSAPLDFIAKIFRPFIVLLSISTNFLVRIFGGDPRAGKEQISGEELRGMVASHEELTTAERELIDDVFDAGDKEIREIMIPRTEVEFLDADLPVFKAAKLVSDLPHSRYPVFDSSHDDVVGFVHVRDILNPDVRERSLRLGELVRNIARLPGSKHVIPALSDMRSTGSHMALVVDEYGGTAGIITLEDLVEELIGDIRDEYDTDESEGVIPVGHEVIVDGLLNLADFADETYLELPDGPYETAGGFIAAGLGRIPKVGDEISIPGANLTVTEMDGRRVSRIRVLRTDTIGQ
ncbi:MAG: HlyC/CorC family transporter [Actinobacteria bacterium]|nr:HlyC/CorC family transporter [Actinomycetota bacterium]NBY15320.1 HlyC/CorC family transporter [Actinomycetota bacterium]